MDTYDPYNKNFRVHQSIKDKAEREYIERLAIPMLFLYFTLHGGYDLRVKLTRSAIANKKIQGIKDLRQFVYDYNNKVSFNAVPLEFGRTLREAKTMYEAFEPLVAKQVEFINVNEYLVDKLGSVGNTAFMAGTAPLPEIDPWAQNQYDEPPF